MKKIYKSLLLLTLPTSGIVVSSVSGGYFTQQVLENQNKNSNVSSTKENSVDQNTKTWIRSKNSDTNDTIIDRASGWLSKYEQHKSETSQEGETQTDGSSETVTINKNEFFLIFAKVSGLDDNVLKILKTGLTKENTMIMDNCRRVIQRLLSIAIAFDVTKDSKLLVMYREIALDFTTNYYKIYNDIIGNWWNYQIGVPKDFLNSLIFVYKSIPEEELDKIILPITWFLKDYKNRFSYDGLLVQPMKLANLVDNVYSVILFSYIQKDFEKLKEALDYMLNDLFGFWASKTPAITRNGFYQDGSYVDHSDPKTKSGGLAYFGGYGIEFISGILDIKQMLYSTVFDFVDLDIFERFYQIVEINIMPYMYELSFSDSLSGRSISRKGYNSKNNGKKIIEILIQFVDDAPINYKSRLVNFILEQTNAKVVQPYLSKQIIEFRKKYQYLPEFKRYIANDWIETNNFNRYNNDDKNNLIPIGKDLFDANNGFLFSKNQDRYLLKKSDYMFTLSLGSNKNFNYETMNGENTLGFYQGDGLTLIQNKETENYANDYFTVVDPYKLPGTSAIYEQDFTKLTDDSEIAKHIEGAEYLDGKSKSKYGNGIFYNNIGLVASSIDNYNSKLKTQKGYFFIDGIILALGEVSVDHIDTTPNNVAKNLANSDTTNQNIKPVYTTIINDFGNESLTETSMNSDLGNLKKYVSNTNAYYVLETWSGSVIKNEHKSRTMKPYVVNRSRKSEENITRSFNEVYIDHQASNNENQKKYGYVIVPSEKNEKDTLNKINKIKIKNKDHNKYFHVEYEDDKYNYSLISTFENNQNVTTNGIGITFKTPTMIMLMKDKKTQEYKVISSSNDDLATYEIVLDRSPQSFQTRKIAGINEVQNLFGTLQVNNNLYYNSDTNHNTWFVFK